MDATLELFINKILTTAAKRQASNIHLTVNSYPALRVNNELVELTDEQIVSASLVQNMANDWLDENQKKVLAEQKEIIVTKEMGKKFRLKMNFFYQKGFLSISLRLIPGRVPPLINLGLPKAVYGLTDKKAGLIIIAGPYGSGRTTTVASMVEEINKSRKENIVVIEDPIEYLFVNQNSLIEQRQVGRDTNTFSDALDNAEESDVDVVAVGVTEEKGVIEKVLEFANSGRLSILSMETTSVVQTVEEFLDNFSPDRRDRAQSLLADNLLAIIVQRLVPRVGGGLILAAEVLISTEAVSSLIKEGRIKQLTTILQTSRAEGMVSLDQSLAELVRSGEVMIDHAIEYATDPQSFRAIAKD